MMRPMSPSTRKRVKCGDTQRVQMESMGTWPTQMMMRTTTKMRRRPDGYDCAYGFMSCRSSDHARYERISSLTRRKRMKAGSGDGERKRSEGEKKRNKRTTA